MTRAPDQQEELQAEVQACHEGVKAAVQLGIGRVILETDSLILKQALTDNSYRLSPVGGALCELKQLMVGSFLSCVVEYAPRVCNKVAHTLAAVGRSCVDESVLSWDSTPSCIVDLVASDHAEPLS